MGKNVKSNLFSGLEFTWDSEETQRFQVQIETGEILEAEMLTVLEMDGNEYAVYTIPGENGKRDVLASRVIQDGDGFDMLVDLESQVVKENIRRFIEETVLRAQNPTAKA